MSFTSLKELIELAEQEKTTISELMIITEVEQKVFLGRRLLKNVGTINGHGGGCPQRHNESCYVSYWFDGEMEIDYICMPKTGTPLSILQH